MKKYYFSRKFVFVMVFVFFLIRLPFLDSTFLLYDERDTALTQYSLAKTGKDLYGNKTPLVFDHISPHAPVLAMYYGVPFYLLGLPKTVAVTRLIYLLPFSIVPLLIFELLFVLTKRKNLSILAAAIFSFSPWVYHISRLGLEINLAFPFFLTALLFQVKRKTLPSIIFYTFSFFSYQGIRPLILVTMIYLELFFLLKKDVFASAAKRILMYVCIFSLLFAASGVIEKNTSGRGSSEIVFLNSTRLTAEVDYNRFISSAPSFSKKLFDNKIIASADYVFKNMMQGLSPAFLFGTGDYVPIYTNGVMGQFYPVFFFFFLAGLLALGKKRNKEYFYVAALSLVGMVSSVINIYSLTFSIRSLFCAVGISFIIALGIRESIGYLKTFSPPLFISIAALFSLIITYQASAFFYRYSFQRPIWQSELYNENERSLANYLIGEDKPYTVKTNNAFAHYLSYLYLKDLNKDDLHEAQKTLAASKGEFTQNNIEFMECQAQEVSFLKQPKRMIIEESCLSSLTKQMIKTSSISYSRITYGDYNYLDTNKRMKYYVFK